MKVLTQEQAQELTTRLEGGERRRRRRRGKAHEPRALTETEQLIQDPHQRRLLANQGVRPLYAARRFPPGTVVSVELSHCGHRTRVETLKSGYVPSRARCPRCVRWQDIVVGSEREPQTRRRIPRVLDERIEERDGRTFAVKVLAPSRSRGT